MSVKVLDEKELNKRILHHQVELKRYTNEVKRARSQEVYSNKELLKTICILDELNLLRDKLK